MKGKRGKIRFVPAPSDLSRSILCWPVTATQRPSVVPAGAEQSHGRAGAAAQANSIYWNVLRKYGQATGLNIEVNGPCMHSMRATAATNALSHEADIAKVQEWLGYANVSTTRYYELMAAHIDQVRERFEQLGTACPFEEVMALCPELTWNQVFLAIDYLSRTGQVRVMIDVDRSYTVQAYRPVAALTMTAA